VSNAVTQINTQAAVPDAHIVTGVENRAIFFGGDTRSGLILLDDIYRLNLATRTWQRPSFEEAPPPHWRGTLTFDPGTRKGYLFGGWRDFGGHDALNDLWALDIERMLWTRLQ